MTDSSCQPVQGKCHYCAALFSFAEELLKVDFFTPFLAFWREMQFLACTKALQLNKIALK